jgi:hypothetical protein
MFDRLLAVLLRFTVTGLIAALGAVGVVTAYSGLMQLARAHVRESVWMIGVAALCTAAAFALGMRRGDLADC